MDAYIKIGQALAIQKLAFSFKISHFLLWKSNVEDSLHPNTCFLSQNLKYFFTNNFEIFNYL